MTAFAWRTGTIAASGASDGFIYEFDGRVDETGWYHQPVYAICKPASSASKTYGLFLATNSSETSDIADGYVGRYIEVIFFNVNAASLNTPKRYTYQQGDGDWNFTKPGAFEVAEDVTRSGGVQSAQAYLGSAFDNDPANFDSKPEIITIGIVPTQTEGVVQNTRRFTFTGTSTPTIRLFYDNHSAYLYMFRMDDSDNARFYLTKRTQVGATTWQTYVAFAFPAGSYFKEFEPRGFSVDGTTNLFVIANTYYWDSSNVIQSNVYSIRFNQSGVIQDVYKLGHNNVATKRIFCDGFSSDIERLNPLLEQSVLALTFERNNFWGMAIFFGYFGGRASGDISQAEILTDIAVDPGPGEVNYYFSAAGRNATVMLDIGGEFQGMRNIVATQDTRSLSIVRLTSFFNFATGDSSLVYWDRQIRVKNTETGNFKFINSVSLTPDHRNTSSKHDNYLVTIICYAMDETIVLSLPVNGNRVGVFTTQSGKYEVYYEYATGPTWLYKDAEWSWTNMGTTGFTSSTPAPTIASPTLSGALTTPVSGFKVIQ